MSKKSNSTHNILDYKLKSKQVLSNLINAENKYIFIKNNKNALRYYKEFVKMQQDKSRNNKLSLEFLNLNSHSKIEKFKNNPILILKSYDKNLFDEKKRKFKSQILGVDEGLITLPKNYNLFESPVHKNIENSNLFEKENETDTNRKYILNKKIRSVTELEKGSEVMFVKRNGFHRINSEKICSSKNKKINNNFENELNYNFELKELDKWDFLNAASNEKPNKKFLILQSPNYRRKSSLNSLINITDQSYNNQYYNMGFLLKFKNDKNKMKIISRIKKLEEFFYDFGKEQDAFLLEGNNKKPKNYFLSAFYGKEKNELFEEKKDKKEKSSEINYYKEITKVKKIKEKMLHDELYKYAEKINLAKNEKEEFEKKGYKLNQELKEINIKESQILNDIKNIGSSKDKMKNNDKLVDLYDKESDNDRKLIRQLSEKGNYTVRRTSSYRDKGDKGDLIFTNDKKTFIKNYFLVKRRKNTIIYNTLSKLRKKRNVLLEEIKENNSNINEKQVKLKEAKNQFNEKVKFLKEYYYQLLKTGLDVRKEGLSWVIVKLSELNAYINKNHFPQFLSNSERDYLMKIGIKQYELSELVKLFQILKKRQKKLKENHIKQDKELTNKLKEENFNKLLESQRGNKYNIGNNYAEFMEEIYRKYENVINIYLNEKEEEDGLNKISNKINKYVLTMKDDDIYDNGNYNEKLYKSFFIPGSLSQYFSKDKKFRQYFDDIYYLSEEINKRKNELKEMKDIEFKKYKNILKNQLNMENNKHIEMSERNKAFSALFGNNIPV